MPIFTQEEFTKLAQDAAIEGRPEELKVLLGPQPLVWKYTHSFVHQKRELEDKLGTWKKTQELLQGIKTSLEKLLATTDLSNESGPNSFSAHQLAINLVRSYSDRVVISTQNKIDFISPQNQINENMASKAIVLSHSRIIIANPWNKIAWSINPYILQAIGEAYQSEQARSMKAWIECALQVEQNATSGKVLEIINELYQGLVLDIEAAEKQVNFLNFQITDQTKIAEEEYETLATDWFTKIFKQIKEQEVNRVIRMRVSVSPQPNGPTQEMEISVNKLIQSRILESLKNSEHVQTPENSPILPALKAAKVPIDTVDSHHYTLLSLALCCQKYWKIQEMTAYLIYGGAELEYPSIDGNTPTKRALQTADHGVIRLVANQKVESLINPPFPDIRWYLAYYCPELTEKGIRDLQLKAEAYQRKYQDVNQTKNKSLWRLSYEFFFLNRNIIMRNIDDARFVHDRAIETILDEDQAKLVGMLSSYKAMRLGDSLEESNEFWSEVGPILRKMAQGFYGDIQKTRDLLQAKCFQHHLWMQERLIKDLKTEKAASDKKFEEQHKAMTHVKEEFRKKDTELNSTKEQLNNKVEELDNTKKVLKTKDEKIKIVEQEKVILTEAVEKHQTVVAAKNEEIFDHKEEIRLLKLKIGLIEAHFNQVLAKQDDEIKKIKVEMNSGPANKNHEKKRRPISEKMSSEPRYVPKNDGESSTMNQNTDIAPDPEVSQIKDNKPVVLNNNLNNSSEIQSYLKDLNYAIVPLPDKKGDKPTN